MSRVNVELEELVEPVATIISDVPLLYAILRLRDCDQLCPTGAHIRRPLRPLLVTITRPVSTCVHLHILVAIISLFFRAPTFLYRPV